MTEPGLGDLQKWRSRLFPAAIGLVLLAGLAFAALEWRPIRAALTQARWRPLPFALAATAISYTCISWSFARVGRLLGLPMRGRDLMAVGFVSVVLNHVVSSGGAAGYSVRYALMNRHGVELRQVLTVSVLHFILTSLVMVAMLPIGLLYLTSHAAIGGRPAGLLAGLAALVILADLLALGLVAWDAPRAKVLGGVEQLTSRILHRDLGPALARFDATLRAGAAAMRTRPAAVAGILGLVAADWAASAAALWFCFGALGIVLTAGKLISGFVIGIVAGVASMIPGGLGVQEGSMAGIFALQGVPLERAVLASVLFRGVYFVLPYLTSLALYRTLLRTQRAALQPVDWEAQHAHPDA